VVGVDTWGAGADTWVGAGMWVGADTWGVDMCGSGIFGWAPNPVFPVVWIGAGAEKCVVGADTWGVEVCMAGMFG
jgi:hypothetical protein